MKRFIQAWADIVVNQRIMVLILTLVFYAFCAFPIYKTVEYASQKEMALDDSTAEEDDNYSNMNDEITAGTSDDQFKDRWLYFDNSNEMWFLKEDPALIEYDLLKDRFGEMEYLLIGIETRQKDKTVFNLETLKMIDALTRYLEDHDVVTKVSSLTKYQYMISEDETLTVTDLIEDIDTLDDTSKTMRELKEIMENEEMVHEFLITPDMKHTIISARTQYVKGSVDHLIKVVRDLRQFIKENHYLEQGFKLRIMGNPVISENFQTDSQKDSSTTFPLMFLLIVIFLAFSFRSVSGVILPLVVIFGSVFSVVGALGYLGFAFNMLNVTIPTLLIAVGVGDSVHILTDFYQFRNQGLPAKAAARKSVEELWMPCFYTSLTTAIGFIAISVSSLLPLREYGYVAAIGVFVAFVISVTTLPALLTFVNKTSQTSKRISEKGFVARLTSGMSTFTLKNSRIIFVIGIIILVLSLIGASQLVVDANWVNYFKEDTDIRNDIEYFDEVYRGGVNLEFMIDSSKADGVKGPEFLGKVLGFQNYLESLVYTGKANSFINYVRKMNQTMHQNDPTFYQIPNSSDAVAQLLLLYENSGPEEDLSDLKTMDHRYMRLSVRVKNMSTVNMKAKLREILDVADKEYSELSMTLTGNLILFVNMDHYIQQGLIQSFTLAIIMIVICFFILFKSFKYGLLSLIPSIIPIVVTGGIMAMAGVTLDFASMIIAAITFGIAVDDTIHIMTRYIEARKNQKTRKESIHLAITKAGRALVYTTLILYFGFTILILSSFTPNIKFGFYGGIIIMTALIADLVLLPAVMFLTGDKAAYKK
ncbi:MAG: RND family transporter [Deltaproteobacteria bacterium]|jgi:uncharacterized protein|nr:RND family transporter [Deltaproteobacteria bacterium]